MKPLSRTRFSLLCVSILVGAVLAAEGLTRWRAQVRFGDLQDVYQLFESLPAGERVLRLVPNSDVQFLGGRVQADSRGLRSPELLDPKPEHGLLVGFLGGSTTFCTQAADNESTWPSLVADTLRSALAVEQVEYFNAAGTGFGVSESRLRIENDLADLEPDVVVIYHATNDLARDSGVLARELGLFDEPPLPSWLEQRLLLWKLILKNIRYQGAQQSGRSSADKLTAPATEWSASFEEELRALVQAVQAPGRRVVLLTFATLMRREQSQAAQLENMAQAFTFMPYLTPEASFAAYEEYNRIIGQVASDTGSLLIDLADEISGDRDHFSDSVHFTEQGCRRMAELVSLGVLDDVQFGALVEATAAASEQQDG